VILSLWIALAAALQARAAVPDTEIFLARLERAAGKLEVKEPVNISSSPGYDNQPSFTPDGSAILFASARAAGGDRTDIYRYEIESRRTLRVTDTPEREYSPAVTPDGRHIAVVRVETDGTQRLWRFPLDGSDPEPILRDVNPVGYYAWADDHTLALFVLGRPPKLALADTRTGKAEAALLGIGRSLQRIPGRGTISFVNPDPAAEGGGPTTFSIGELDPRTRQASSLVRAPGPGEVYCAWTPDGTLLVAHGGVLYGWRRGAASWSRIADLEALGLPGATRIAVSPKGDRIAIVTEAQAK
jgi:dipeptidyl aminopeptidase/acylaminoacyl peptidase